MKAKKLTILIALIAIVGTFTFAIPQQALADNDLNDFCAPIFGSNANPQNTDTHTLTPVIQNINTVQLQGIYTNSPNVKTSVLTFFININVGTATNPALGALQSSIDSTLEQVAAMKTFTGTLPVMGENNYVGYACGKESESTSTPTPVIGLHHTETVTFRIDRTAPEITCGDLAFNQSPTDGPTILKSDSRFDDFFGRGNPATSLLTVSDLLDDDPTVIDNAPTNIPVGQTVSVIFTASDDGDIPNTNGVNSATATCDIFITLFKRPGCDGRTLDQSGAPLEIELCLEIPVKESDCGLTILTNPPTTNYGTLNQQDTSEIQTLRVQNTGNAPALLKVVAGDQLDLINTPGFWLDPNEVGAPPFTEQMAASTTHFSVVDPGTTDPTALATFYDDTTQSFAVSDSVKKIIVPILENNVPTDIFWQLRILLANTLFFGDMQQTLTLELQECSIANECEILGETCPETGDVFLEPNG